MLARISRCLISRTTRQVLADELSRVHGHSTGHIPQLALQLGNQSDIALGCPSELHDVERVNPGGEVQTRRVVGSEPDVASRPHDPVTQAGAHGNRARSFAATVYNVDTLQDFAI
jgi:hypothetical protein